MANISNCDLCMNYEYDEDLDCYDCMIDLDEDETAAFVTGNFKQCPYYNPGDEYTIVRKQN